MHLHLFCARIGVGRWRSAPTDGHVSGGLVFVAGQEALPAEEDSLGGVPRAVVSGAPSARLPLAACKVSLTGGRRRNPGFRTRSSLCRERSRRRRAQHTQRWQSPRSFRSRSVTTTLGCVSCCHGSIGHAEACVLGVPRGTCRAQLRVVKSLIGAGWGDEVARHCGTHRECKTSKGVKGKKSKW